MNCPECKIELEKAQGLGALVIVCPKCKKEFVQCYERLVPLSEFKEAVKEYNG